MNIELKNKSKYLSLILRHKPEKENLIIDENGYVLVRELLEKLDISIFDLRWIVKNNDKKRFEFNDDESLIRASQGHSIKVELELKVILPPDILYHGTSMDNKEKITNSGLNKMNRNHVHLTDNVITALDVGMRYAKNRNNLWLIKIDAKKMNNDGYNFYKSKNDVYLTDNVPSKYFIIGK